MIYVGWKVSSHRTSNCGATAGWYTEISSKIPQLKGAKWHKLLNNGNKDELFQLLIKKLQAKTTDANSHLFTTKADQVLSNRPTVIAMYLCKHNEVDTRVNSTWNVPLNRGTIKPTSEQWTHVWLSLPSHTCITWGMVRQGDVLRNFYPCDMWFLNSLERNAAKPCYSSMPT